MFEIIIAKLRGLLNFQPKGPLRQVKLIRKKGNLLLIPIDKFFEDCSCKKPKRCKVIKQEPFSWLIHEKINKGCAWDGLGDEIIVHDFTKADEEFILKNNGKCFVEVDYKNRMSIPKNMLGDGKIVIFK